MSNEFFFISVNFQIAERHCENVDTSRKKFLVHFCFFLNRKCVMIHWLDLKTT